MDSALKSDEAFHNTLQEQQEVASKQLDNMGEGGPDDEDDEDYDLSMGSIKDELASFFSDDRMEVARVKNQDKGETEMIQKEMVINKLDRQNKMSNVAKIIKDLPWDERLQWIQQQKSKGNRLFRKGLFAEAAEVYQFGLMGIEFDNQDTEKQRQMREENIMPLLTNIATCMLRLEKYNTANSVCDKALKVDGNNVKANCKKGESLMYCGDYDNAVAFLKKALQLTHSEVDKNNIYHIYKKLRARRSKEQEKYKSLFPPQEKELNQLLTDQQDTAGEEQSIYDEGNNGEDDEEKQEQEEEEGDDDDDESEGDMEEDDKNNIDERNARVVDEDFEVMNKYIGPLSYLLYVPIWVVKKLATAVGCKKRIAQKNSAFDFDSYVEPTNGNNSQKSRH